LAWLGLAWLGLAWLGLAWLGLAWLGLAWLGLAWLGFPRRVHTAIGPRSVMFITCYKFGALLVGQKNLTDYFGN
jgi:hypothetical protein